MFRCFVLNVLRPVFILFFGLTFLTGVVYPFLITELGNLAFPDQAQGSFILSPTGKIQGSSLIGQNFQRDEYFHNRPSGAGQGYDAMSSGGRNLSPANPLLIADIADNALSYQGEQKPIPIDLITFSASGLDPHISPEAARLQIRRIANVRAITERDLENLVAQHIDGRTLFILGDPRVNVLVLNTQLDLLFPYNP